MITIDTAIGIAGLILGYLGSRGELQRIIRGRRLPKLQAELTFYQRLNASPSERTTYLVETLVILFAILGAGTMFGSIPYFATDDGKWFEGSRLWSEGLALYLFSMFRLGKYWNATRRYDKTINAIQQKIAQNGG